jgi:hypothetical protein
VVSGLDTRVWRESGDINRKLLNRLVLRGRLGTKKIAAGVVRAAILVESGA